MAIFPSHLSAFSSSGRSSSGDHSSGDTCPAPPADPAKRCHRNSNHHFPKYTRNSKSQALSLPTHLLLSLPAKYVTLNRQDVTAVSKARLQRSPPAKTWYKQPTQPKPLSFNVCSGIWKGREDMSCMVIMSSFLEWEGLGWYFFCLPWKLFCNGFNVKEMAHHRLRFHE